jgi:spoIIIJ-associated protein
MSEKSGQTSLEIIAPTVEEAVENGLAQLNLPEEAVQVEILDRGNRGLFGLGSRDARVRLIVREDTPITNVEKTPRKREKPAQTSPTDVPAPSPALTKESELVTETVSQSLTNELNDEEERIVKITYSTVIDLLERMNVKAEVSASYRQPEYEGDRATVWIDITGNDLAVLIGRRSQTLHALQYITALIVGKEIGHAIPLVIDVEGFRSRRETQLRRIATTMAEQALKTGRVQALEPMPANERRIIHMTLRDYPGVTTESLGEEPHRKVTIIPKKQN